MKKKLIIYFLISIILLNSSYSKDGFKPPSKDGFKPPIINGGPGGSDSWNNNQKAAFEDKLADLNHEFSQDELKQGLDHGYKNQVMERLRGQTLFTQEQSTFLSDNLANGMIEVKDINQNILNQFTQTQIEGIATANPDFVSSVKPDFFSNPEDAYTFVDKLSYVSAAKDIDTELLTKSINYIKDNPDSGNDLTLYNIPTEKLNEALHSIYPNLNIIGTNDGFSYDGKNLEVGLESGGFGTVNLESLTNNEAQITINKDGEAEISYPDSIAETSEGDTIKGPIVASATEIEGNENGDIILKDVTLKIGTNEFKNFDEVILKNGKYYTTNGELINTEDSIQYSANSINNLMQTGVNGIIDGEEVIGVTNFDGITTITKAKYLTITQDEKTTTLVNAENVTITKTETTADHADSLTQDSTIAANLDYLTIEKTLCFESADTLIIGSRGYNALGQSCFLYYGPEINNADATSRLDENPFRFDDLLKKREITVIADNYENLNLTLTKTKLTLKTNDSLEMKIGNINFKTKKRTERGVIAIAKGNFIYLYDDGHLIKKAKECISDSLNLKCDNEIISLPFSNENYPEGIFTITAKNSMLIIKRPTADIPRIPNKEINLTLRDYSINEIHLEKITGPIGKIKAAIHRENNTLIVYRGDYTLDYKGYRIIASYGRLLEPDKREFETVITKDNEVILNNKTYKSNLTFGQTGIHYAMVKIEDKNILIYENHYTALYGKKENITLDLTGTIILENESVTINNQKYSYQRNYGPLGITKGKIGITNETIAFIKKPTEEIIAIYGNSKTINQTLKAIELFEINSPSYKEININSEKQNSTLIITNNTIEIKNGILDLTNETIKGNLNATYTDKGIECINLSTGSEYIYETNILTSFGIKPEEQYSLCLRKNKTEQFQQCSNCGIYDFIESKAELNGKVSYLRYPRYEELLTDFFLRPIYQGTEHVTLIINHLITAMTMGKFKIKGAGEYYTLTEEKITFNPTYKADNLIDWITTPKTYTVFQNLKLTEKEIHIYPPNESIEVWG